MAVIHISEADAVRDFAGLLAQVRAGKDIVIDNASASIRLSLVAERPGRLLSESIALAKANSDEAAMDAEFASDMEQIIRERKPRDTSAWD